MKMIQTYKRLKSRGLSLKTRMLATFIPVAVMALLVTGYATYEVSTNFLRATLENEGRIHVASLVHELEQFLERCRKDLLTIAQDPPSPAKLSRHLALIREIGGIDYRMLAFISQSGDDHSVYVAKGDTVERIPASMAGDIRPNLFALYDDIKGLEPGETWISRVRRMEYPFPIPENPNLKSVSSTVYFGTPCFSGEHRLGYLVLAVEMQNLKEISASYHQRDSRIPPFPPEGVDTRYSYFFDTDGWILFDSGNPADPKSAFNTDLARYGYMGILGNPENPSGFKPDFSFESFWVMIDQVKQGKYGVTKTANLEIQSPTFKEHFCAFGPVLFTTGNNKPPLIYGGVAFVDRSRMTEAIGYKHMGVMSTVSFGAILLFAVVVFSLAHYITRPLTDLTRAVDRMQQSGRMEYLETPRAGYETDLLKDSINALISRVKEQLEQIRISERLREEAVLRVSAEIGAEEPHARTGSLPIEIPEIIGNSARIQGLKAEILKAAGVDADVLIVGETGTGKQLAAEAIHRYSGRSGHPLVCINCGELDEHLLLDSLFGHVAGAFTEAKKDRKGAFLEANGGILFLDEIQTASPSVQQALLRAISQRTFRPLGSDASIEVDVRVIAATNADLKELVSAGKFRQDLYYRLNVITIQTPPLREIREDIPLLVRHYFGDAKRLSRKENLRMSKGALERLKSYEWPGNVRELKNCLTRSVVMSEGPVIQLEEFLLETGGQAEKAVSPALAPPSAATAGTAERDTDGTRPPRDTEGLNVRQKKAYPLIIEKGSISRLEYQWAVGGRVPSRTAIYDLQNMVRKGLLEKRGNGPATRYVLPGRSGFERSGIRHQRSAKDLNYRDEVDD
jgi:DNA-binding NtrC family response regulator